MQVTCHGKIAFCFLTYADKMNTIWFLLLLLVLLKISSTVEVKPQVGKLETSFGDCPAFWDSLGQLQPLKLKCSDLPTILKPNESSILRNICFLDQTLISFLCTKIGSRRNFNDTLTVQKWKCPIKLSLPNTIKKNFTELENFLENEGYCQQVCFDFNAPDPLCSLLVKLNEILEKTLESTSPNIGHAVSSEKNELNSEYSSKKDNVLMGNKKEVTTLATKTEKPSFLADVKKSKGTIVQKLKEEKINKINEKSMNASTVTPQNAHEYTGNENRSTQEVKNSSDGGVSTENTQNEEKYIEQGNEDFQVNDNSGLDETESQANTYSNPNSASGNASPRQYNSLETSNYVNSEKSYFQAEDSHFFFYFLMLSSVVIIGYLAFHNKNKILAYALEGRNSRQSRRRPNSANYRKLETNLEEAIASATTHGTGSSVVY